MPTYTMREFYAIRDEYNSLLRRTYKALEIASKIVEKRNQTPKVVKRRHSIILHLHFMRKWQTLLNKARVTLDERTEIPFPPLHSHEKRGEWDNPTSCTIRYHAHEISAMAKSVNNIVTLANCRLPLVPTFEECRILLFPKQD